MKVSNIKSLSIEDVKVVTFDRFKDDRGYFTEHYNVDNITDIIGSPIKQCNESDSHTGVIRGLHFQWNPFMGKLIRTINGHMIDIVLDIRKGSPTLGKALLYDMCTHRADNKSEWIWVPPGFAHGNIFLEDTTIEYLCTGTYNSNSEAGINPLSIDIDWSLADKDLIDIFDTVKHNAIISSKDTKSVNLETWLNDERSNNFIYGEC